MFELIAATVAYGVLVTGVFLRKNRTVHPLVMLTGLGIDFFLVALLQIQRSVIQEAMSEPYTALQMGHIVTSTLAVVFYFPTIYFGVRQWRGKGNAVGRAWHIRMALTAFTFRTIGFILMWSHSLGI